MGRAVTGVVGRVGVWSSDGRLVEPDLRVAALPLPLLVLTGPALGHAGAELAGRVTAASVADGEVRIAGLTLEDVAGGLLPPGRYACGMDLRVGTVTLEGDRQRVSGELLAVTVHGPGSTGGAVWDGVYVEVAAGE